MKSKYPITTLQVRPARDGEGRGTTLLSGDSHWILTHLDDVRVPSTGKQIDITIRLRDRHAGIVYIEGGLPLYETFVYDQDQKLLAHSRGLIVAKMLDEH